jgi:dihydrofolate reductase
VVAEHGAGEEGRGVQGGNPGAVSDRPVRGSIADEVAALKEQQGKDIVTTGSITLVHELIALGLVDEYRLFIYPVVLGHGRRLFQDANNVPALVLQDVQRFGSTIVLTTYRIAG